MKQYNGLYIFAATAKDDVLNQLVEKVKGEITRLSGKVLDTDIQGKKTFARPMHKRDCGVYVKIKFESDPSAIKTLTDRYHLMEDVFRVQFTAIDERRQTRLAKQAEVQAAREAARKAAAEKAEAEAAAAAPAAAAVTAPETTTPAEAQA